MLIFSTVDSLLSSFQGSREKRDKKIKKKSVSAITFTRASVFYIRFLLNISYN